MTIKDIYELIPELYIEEDEQLRKKCAEVWLSALTIGGWEEKGVYNCTTALGMVTDDCPENAVLHCRRVVRACKAVYSELGQWANEVASLDYNTLIAGALVHDVGKFLEYDYKDGRPCQSTDGMLYRHVISGAYLAKQHDLPDAVVHMVLCHSNAQSPEGSAAYQTPELTVLKYIDHMCFMIAQTNYHI